MEQLETKKSRHALRIDFHQLQIENQQFVARIDERNDELIKLKLSTGIVHGI
jgi:hypothetical protein